MSKRILVVDDEEAVRNAFGLALRKLPYQVDSAENGRVALELMGQNAYDLVYLDLKMPEMNGVETLKAIRALNQSVPVYIVTAFHREFLDDLAEARKARMAFELVMKPLGMDQIIAVTRGVLEGPQVMEDSDRV